MDIGGFEQFGEDKGIWGRGRLSDEIDGGSRGVGRLCEEDIRFESAEGFLLDWIHALSLDGEREGEKEGGFAGGG